MAVEASGEIIFVALSLNAHLEISKVTNNRLNQRVLGASHASRSGTGLVPPL
jgi:hypothetical protein